MNTICQQYRTGDMQILIHHIYEYQKGLRNLVLHTISIDLKKVTEELLIRKGISYYLQQVSSRKINVFFGNQQCLQIITSFGNKSLSHLSDEEDFILGIMLGYDRKQQCRRYLKRKYSQSENNIPHLAIAK